jgi:hypothetical protein
MLKVQSAKTGSGEVGLEHLMSFAEKNVISFDTTSEVRVRN